MTGSVGGGDAVNWNYYRYAADYLHFGGMLLGLAAILYSRSVQGFSRKTQVLFQLVYITRYLDIFTTTQAFYLFFFKITFNVITAAMLLLFWHLHKTYDAVADSCNIVAIVVPLAITAHLTSSSSGLEEELWTFSEYLEPFALIPQYIMCHKAAVLRPETLAYVLAVGGYRALYVCNWLYKRSKLHSAYHDYTSWVGGLLECIFFADFVVRILRRGSGSTTSSYSSGAATFLGSVLVNFDDKAGEISERIEMRTLGRRIPFGLSGHPEKEEDDLKPWGSADQFDDEEGKKLLTLSGDADL
mmetsp:Transcript_51624/g.122861  ORF Transcript_51624/g.122861 Transcript_51624/m.122861 type:complete len:300 (-) Transcript_51624:125-1024(-)